MDKKVVDIRHVQFARELEKEIQFCVKIQQLGFIEEYDALVLGIEAMRTSWTMEEKNLAAAALHKTVDKLFTKLVDK